jgi:hypothetical protein
MLLKTDLAIGSANSAVAMGSEPDIAVSTQSEFPVWSW